MFFSRLQIYEKNDSIIFMKVKKNKKIGTKSSLQQLGKDLRALRKAQGMTLQALAEASGKSVSFLSKIERGLARPSITALQDIAEALKMPIGWFFQNDGPVPADERPYIVRAKRRRRLTYSDMTSTDYMGFEDHLLSANLDGQLAMGISRYEPGGTAGDDLYTHRGEEAGLVLEGEIELCLDKKVFRLNAGDSFSFPSSIPHTYRNPGKVPSFIVWANTPVSLRH
jgi:transcriptional regulator with XRE-family HTH domain